MGLRDQVFADGPKLLRDVAGFEPTPLVPNAVTDDVVWDCVTCGACVQRVPGVDRARRPHRRPAPQPRDGRVALPDRGRADAARRRARRQPVGPRADRARRLGRAARRADPRAGRAGARGPLLGRLRRVVRRARAHGGGVDGEAAAGGGRRLRDPRPARDLHRRPGAADGQRVPVPGAGRAERRDAQRGGRDQDRRELPALLQHARQRVRRLRRRTTRSCTTRS